MIIDILFTIISLVLQILNGVLSAIPLTVPSQLASAFQYFGGYLSLAGGYIDIAGVFGAFTFLLNFMLAWFSFKVIMWIYHTVIARRVHEKQALPAQVKK